jgi:hypothetical protein
MEATSIRFAQTAKALSDVVRSRNLELPLFRSPPRLAGVQRSLKRRRVGASTVSVQLRQRPWPAVVADMIEGIVVVNRLSGAAADELRNALWHAVGASSVAA